MAADSSGHFLYVANNGDNNVSAYTIDQATGALTQIAGSPFPAGAAPLAIEIDDAGKLLYVPNSVSKTVTVYSMDSATGKLQTVQTLPTQGFACSVALVN